MDTEELAVGQYAPARSPACAGAPRCLDDLGQLTWIPVETELQGEPPSVRAIAVGFRGLYDVNRSGANEPLSRL